MTIAYLGASASLIFAKLACVVIRRFSSYVRRHRAPAVYALHEGSARPHPHADGGKARSRWGRWRCGT